MYLKIYFNDKPLFLCDATDSVITPYLHHDDTVFIDELNTHTVKTMIHEMQQEKIHAGVFLHPDLCELKKAFWKKFTIIQAAGGLVFNEKDEVLLIFRRGKWDLPKGKAENNETLEECAIREVQEETGLQNIQLLSPLITTYHTYHEGSAFILKESYWFTIKANKTDNLIPQTEEDIHEIRWAGKDEQQKYLENTFPSIRDVFQAVALK